jgi:hypothetical protein
MTNTVYGLFPDPDRAQRAVDSLRAAGVEERAVVIISSEPFDEYEFGRRDYRTHMPWLAALGGLAGGTAGYGLASLTQEVYPLVTGGMPISPWWTNGIIAYELTMLGAILATLVVLLSSARLPDWTQQLYDPAVADGSILVGAVHLDEFGRGKVQEILHSSGAEEVKELTAGSSRIKKTPATPE